MATIHLIQQGKGGVGKSMIAAVLYQALRHLGKEVVAYDTDPANNTLAGFKELKVVSLNIMKNGDIIPRAFDPIFEGACELPAGTHVIIDNGASSFFALGAYLSKDKIIPLLNREGHTVYLHTVIVGGQAMTDTVSGLKRLALGFPDTPIVVWLNYYFGDIVMDGKPFETFKAYQEHQEQFHAVIEIPQCNQSTVGVDLAELFAKRKTFESGISGSQSIIVRSRLFNYWQDLLAAIKQAQIAG